MGPSPATDSPTPSGVKPLIFVVDDDPILLELASGILMSAGYDIKGFTDPATALRAFTAAKPPPALVITDYAMGRLSGTDLIRECRRVSPQQRIVLLSGTADESVFASSPSKPDRFLAKPYKSEELIHLVQSILSNPQAGNHPI